MPRIRELPQQILTDDEIADRLGIAVEKFRVDGLHNKPPTQKQFDDLPASTGHRQKVHRDGDVPSYFPGENTQRNLDRWSGRASENSYRHQDSDFPPVGSTKESIERAQRAQVTRMARQLYEATQDAHDKPMRDDESVHKSRERPGFWEGEK